MRFLFFFMFFSMLGGVFSALSSTVVAKFSGGTLTLDDIKKAQTAGPEQLRAAPLDKIFGVLRDQKLIEAILSSAQKTANASQDPEFQKMKADALKALEMQFFLKKTVEARITNAKLQPLYQELVKKLKGQQEIEVKIIVCDSKDVANKALQELNSGKDFGDVAQKYSVEPNTKAQGGRVGFLLQGAIEQVLGPDVAKNLKILKSNSHSRSVVPTKGGKYILVYRGDSRAATPPKFDDVREQLKGMYFQKALVEYLQELIKRSNVQVYTMDGKPDQFRFAKTTATTKSASTEEVEETSGGSVAQKDRVAAAAA